VCRATSSTDGWYVWLWLCREWREEKETEYRARRHEIIELRHGYDSDDPDTYDEVIKFGPAVVVGGQGRRESRGTN
jgi:hypothetical protein